jgi:serine/threonine-protein kinase
MGEVWRARDLKLQRDVAIKVLPQTVADDPERLARFAREATTLAALNHPNIAHIHGFEDSTGVPALVMELVEGPTLADRVAKGPIPLDEALAVARQIAEGLEAAHEQGIIHRDLKPANIKVREDGTVKILDFGLAKALEPKLPSGVNVTQPPTITTPAMMTGVGVLLGTAAYMSPEQARGKPIDKRADIWAFGVVLYELLTGRRAFQGEEVSDTLAFVLTQEPDWSALPAKTPPAITKLLRRCLDKDRKRRLADIADARFEMDEALRWKANAESSSTSLGRATPKRATTVLLSLWAVTTTGLAIVALVLLSTSRAAAPRAPLRLAVEVGANLNLGGPGQSIDISPAGDMITFVGQSDSGSALYLRRLNQLSASRLEGTVGASSPFFSPDGQWIGYFADGKLKKVSVNGGASVTLTEDPGARGGAWSEDGSIVFMHNPIAENSGGAGQAPGGTLSRVAAAGGQSERLTTVDGTEITHRWPQVLSGGTAVLFTASENTGGYEDAHIVVQEIPAGRRKTVVTGGYHARYVPSGHLLYMHAGTLFAVPFDLKHLETTGPAVPAVEGVASNPGTAAAHFSVSNSGTLAYIPGEAPLNTAPIVWIDHTGKVEPLRKERDNWSNLQFSPDGRRLAFDVRGAQFRIWTYDIERETATQLTLDDAVNSNPVWSPDGRYIAFASRRIGSAVANLFIQRSDGSGDSQRLLDNQTNGQSPSSWHPSGKFLAFNETRPGSAQDILMLPLEGGEVSWKPGKPFPFVATPKNEFDAQFSPDGRWVAYISTESGFPDVYVRPFPGPGGKWKISTEPGARFPVWSRTRRELLYRTAAGDRLMYVTYTVEGDSFRADKPQLWAEGAFNRPNGQRGFDIHPDGQRVAASGGRDVEVQGKQDKAVFIFNFFDELRRIAPLTR